MKATTYPTTWRHNHPWIERVSWKKKQKEEGCVVVVVAQAVDGAATKTVAPRVPGTDIGTPATALAPGQLFTLRRRHPQAIPATSNFVLDRYHIGPPLVAMGITLAWRNPLLLALRCVLFCLEGARSRAYSYEIAIKEN